MTEMLSHGTEPDAMAAATEAEGEKKIQGRTPWQLVRARLWHDKVTMVILGVVGFAVLLAIAAPILSATGVLDPFKTDASLLDVNAGSVPKGAWGGMTWEHPLGVEPGTGRDVLSRLVLGVTFSLTVALASTLVAIIIGTVVGLISGFAGGKVDFVLSRIIDMVLTFPQTLMLIALSGMFIAVLTEKLHVPPGNPANGLYIILVLGLFGWPGFARIIRGQVLSLREREFIEAARSLGARNGRIYFKELLPNLWAPVLVYFTLMLPAFISAEAALSFLGVGIKPPTPTLGNILTDSVNYSTAAPTFFFFPAIIIAILVLSLNLLGDGLRDALDPKGNR
ncbi:MULTISPECIES: ABC transporter permease [unclassified Janibacter]|uniref:ABC transporter permease n=1 Tax=unclassified Janibacter TaxID=2649294 RepID=UPI003D006D94